MFLLLFTAVALGTVTVVCLPLVRGVPAAVDRGYFDRVVYRDQLKEVERDLARGVLSPTEAELGAARNPASFARGRSDRDRHGAVGAESCAGLRHRAAGAGRRDGAVSALWRAVLAGCAVRRSIRRAYGAAAGTGRRAAYGHAAGRGGAGEEAARRSVERGGLGIVRPHRVDAGRLPEGRKWRIGKRSVSVRRPPNCSPLMARCWCCRRTGSYRRRRMMRSPRSLAIDPKNDVARYYLALGDEQAGEEQRAIDRWTALAADIPDDSPMRKSIAARRCRGGQGRAA